MSDNVAHALAGAGGGAVSMVLTYPLITLSTRAQTESSRNKKEQVSDSEPRKNAGVVDAARQIVQREGIAGLYSGLESALFGISVTNFIYYYFYEGTRGFYENSKRTRGDSNLRLSTLESMVAGAIAGSATVVATNPIWVVNTRMTVSGKKASTLATVREIIKADGVTALFAGIGPALVLVINPILQYTIFEQLRNAIEKRRRLTGIDAFLLGALTKMISTSITYPYTRLQVNTKADSKSAGLIAGISKILKEEGVSGLYRGLNTKVVQSALTSAFLFFFKEQLYVVSLAILGVLRSIRLRK